MEPSYMNELRYSYLVGSFRRPTTENYQVQSPESSFETIVQSLYLEGQGHLHHEEYNLALNAFRELMALILRTVHPQMPIDPNAFPYLTFPFDVALVDSLAAQAATILKSTPVAKYSFPATVVNEQSALPEAVVKTLGSTFTSGLHVTSYHGIVDERLAAAGAAVDKENWTAALENYQVALDSVPDTDPLLKGSLLHDMAVLSEKAGDRAGAEAMGTKSIDFLKASQQLEAQVQALDTMTGILQRDGKNDQSATFAQQATTIRSTNNINAVITESNARVTPILGATSSVSIGGDGGSHIEMRAPIAGVVPGRGVVQALAGVQNIPTAVVPITTAPVLMAMKFIKPDSITKSFTMQGTNAALTIDLNGNAGASATNFLRAISTTADLGLLSGIFWQPQQMVAYLPHMYFFIIPMAMGDCLAGMGNLQQAADQYQSVLAYPFINVNFELITLWTRLAQAYLDLGDEAYRRAKDNTAEYGTAQAFYERIVLADKTLNAASPLYTDARFATIKTRVTTFLSAADPATHNDNPAITAIVLQALARLHQITQGLNFFGFGPDYAPPFSFEYLQNTARYFAQQAAQIEERYIQFKSQAENEQLRRDQLNQQAEVARQSVVLEQRGVAEAQRGIDVAAASLDYAQVQLANANQTKTDFQNTRWELLELSEAEAWASASAVDHDDEVKLTWNGNYYSSSKKPRNQVLQDLASQRGRLSQDLEAAKLDREIAAAQAYQGVAQAQMDQARARLDTAQQRVVVAQLQQKYAEENRDFLDMREFGSQLWYQLAQQAKRLKQRYLDMATEMAFLMERAYNAETERGLFVIRYDYETTSSGNLMGANLLLADIDYFTVDLVTTTTTKKNPVKKTISLADAYPMQFQTLKTAGRCLFETALEDFDREYPGFYLAKIRNVELVFVGITEATSIAGTLRNVGVSRMRRASGTVIERLYPADVMALSQYDIRQDSLAFRFTPNELRLFENNGIATLWQLDLPPSANDFDYADILDVHLILYYDGFFDRALENQIKAGLPTTGSASRAFSMRMSFPDELFFLKNQGEAELVFDASQFPRNQTKLVRTRTTLKLTGQNQTVQNLTIRLVADSVGPNEIELKTDDHGEVLDSSPGSPLQGIRNKSMLDRWSLHISAADNPQLVHNGLLDLSGLTDVLIFEEYGFTYR